MPWSKTRPYKTRNGNLLDYMNYLFVLKGGTCFMKEDTKEVLKLLKLMLLCLLLVLVIWLLK